VIKASLDIDIHNTQ